MCKAGGVTNFAKVGILVSHPNYGKPCVPIEGVHDGKKIFSCRFCGKDLECSSNATQTS